MPRGPQHKRRLSTEPRTCALDAWTPLRQSSCSAVLLSHRWRQDRGGCSVPRHSPQSTRAPLLPLLPLPPSSPPPAVQQLPRSTTVSPSRRYRLRTARTAAPSSWCPDCAWSSCVPAVAAAVVASAPGCRSTSSAPPHVRSSKQPLRGCVAQHSTTEQPQRQPQWQPAAIEHGARPLLGMLLDAHAVAHRRTPHMRTRWGPCGLHI
jgi:hypothetical protein